MTQVFSDDGAALPATVLKAGPCVVVQRKTVERDGYESVQLGLVEDKPARVTRPVAGHFSRANVPPTRVLRELPIASGEETEGVSEGEQVLVSLFEAGDQVDVTGVSRGRGSRVWSSDMALVAAAPLTVRCFTGHPGRLANRRIRRVS